MINTNDDQIKQSETIVLSRSISTIIDQKALREYVRRRSLPMQKKAIDKLRSKFDKGEMYSGFEIRRIIRLAMNEYKSEHHGKQVKQDN